jgi:hypothetical protein
VAASAAASGVPDDSLFEQAQENALTVASSQAQLKCFVPPTMFTAGIVCSSAATMQAYPGGAFNAL